MSIGDLEEAFELIRENEDQADFVGDRDEPLIASAEAALGLSFPETYRRFLARLGCGDIAGAEFYGLVDQNSSNSSVPNGIWLTLKLRREKNLPQSLIIVSDTGDGGYYAIDSSRRGATNECPIVSWYPGQRDHPKVADDFGHFMLTRLRESL